MDNQKDFFIKEKLQKDKIISKKADDVFNNFLKGDFNMNQEDKNVEVSKENKENTKVKNKKKYKKILATAASFFVIFGAANVYAMTQGYDNIFFMIKYLTTGNQSLVTNKDEILSDSDISISYEPIKITSDIRLQIKNLQIKDNEAKLFLVVNEDDYENNTDIVPLNYKVYNSENTLLCTQTSSKDSNQVTMYTEELVLKNLKTTDKILKLEIYKNDSKLITKIKIDLDKRTIEVEGEAEALKKVSEIELKQYLGYPTLIRNFQTGEIMYDDWKVWSAIITANNMGYEIKSKEFKNLTVEQYYNTPYGYKVDDINLILDSVFGMKIENFEYNPENDFFIHEENGEKYFVTAYAGGLPGPVECIDITDISYCGGMYTVTYTYCSIGENATVFDVDINDYDIYEQTIIFELNENEEYKNVSKFRMISSEPPVIIKAAADKEEGGFEGEIIIPNNPDNEIVEDLPVNEGYYNSDELKAMEEYYEGVWGGYFSGNMLTIRKDKTFFVKFNDEIIDRGTISFKEGNSDILHILLKYDSGKTEEFFVVKTGEISLRSLDTEEVYEWIGKENNTDVDVPEHSEENSQNENKVDNYASTMSWVNYWAPGLRFKYPEIFKVKEYGGYYRGSNQGELSTAMSGKAIGVNPDTKEIVESDLTIAVYEPLHRYVSPEEWNSLEMKCKTITKDGIVWYEDYIEYEDGGTEIIYRAFKAFADDSEGYVWEYKIGFTTNNFNNYKVINIINWFIGTIEFTSY